MKRITIKDIASMLQINPSTVSRALKNHPDISDQLKAKVKEIAETFHYVPNDFAINFRKKSSKVIGLIIPEFTPFFIPSIIKGISLTLSAENYHFFILSSEESFEKEKENIQTCINSNVDGVLISLSSTTNTSAHLEVLKELEIPTVIFDKTFPQNYFQEVLFDNTKKTQNCVEKLAKYHCKKILALLGNETLEITKNRRKIFEEEIIKYPNIEYKIVSCTSAENAVEKLDIVLDYERFDGFFAMSDETLAGLNMIFMKKNIPTNQIKVMAISEGIWPKYLNQNFEFETNDAIKMGNLAARILLDEIIKIPFTQGEQHFL